MSAVSHVKFLVTNEAKLAGIVNPVVCIIRNVSVQKNATQYDEKILEIMSKLKELSEKVPTPEIQGFRELYRGIGSKVVPVGENLLKNCIKRETFPRYNNLVDAYNILALETITPIGVHDAKGLIKNGTLLFKRAHGDEKIVPAFQDKEFTIPKGDFTYGIKDEKIFDPFAWLGKKDVDSKKYQLQEDSKEFLLTAIGHKTTTQDHNISLCQKALEYVKLSCPDAEMEIILPEFIENEQEVNSSLEN